MSVVKKNRSEEAACREAEQFNRDCPLGTAVRYWPTNDRWGGFLDTKTRSEAYVLSGHTAVVMVEGRSGCVALSHVERTKTKD